MTLPPPGGPLMAAGTLPDTKQERKARDQANRVKKLTVGQDRIWRLQRIATFTEADADFAEDHGISEPLDVEGTREDALFLRRLAWDLEAMHDAVHGRRPSLDPQGPRP